MKRRTRNNHINGKQIAKGLGWRKDYKILAPTWLVNSYSFSADLLR